MKRLLFVAAIFLQVCIAQCAEPLRALLITGGCCHDYEAQKKIIAEGVSARANFKWTILHEGGDSKDHHVSIYHQPNWAKDYDIVVHNECFGQVTNVSFVENIARAHSNGVPAVVLHCSMHSYRDAATDAWRETIGVSSFRHQHRGPVEVKNLKPEHPIMKDFPASWQTPDGELYEIEKVWPNTVPLAQAYGKASKKDQVCIWVNTVGKTRIFGTTLGHFNSEMGHPVYLDTLTRGMLWACGKLDENGKPLSDFGPQK